ncbi:iron complex transport system substrate-binding protein [Paenibacillus sp. UNCCL117]|uniref:iron-hydroxamate ABC transporter substrate-binding protein n=1 Tax=unclassified Paenibacillus TaxID=185978 RepID=UPI00088F7C8A|nr:MULTISPECIES: iron-hydroxamate ABC transporter substrate-binding protein [unclassified Paenibacillus]SDC90315.1 iron complex transport system substrate-binding protein [Paenibacillus sp. cl123]SFW28801.1 iron complex transport system substrate-binding protein [Paenibacillus sp. UNCCL117]
MTRNKWVGVLMAASLAVSLSACGTAAPEAKPASGGAAAETKAAEPAKTAAPEKTTKTIKYLGKEYTVPAKTDRIVITGALEAMEDAMVLGVKPVGGITIGGKFPPMFDSISQGVESIGEKTQPNVETILKLKPDVILGTTKFPADVAEKLGKVGPLIQISHISTDWEANLRLLGELSGKQAEAEKALAKYKEDAKAAKEKLSGSLKDKKVVIVRVRQGSINVYPETVFLNPSLYTDLGLTVPEEIKQAKAQQVISLEKFSEINPDYLFVQFSEDENKDNPKAMEDLQKNPIWQNIKAVKDGKVFVNVIDPLAQGGTAWSKMKFLEAALPKLSN